MGSRKDNRTYIRFNDFWLRLFGVPITGLIIAFLILGAKPEFAYDEFFYFLISSTIFTFVYWEFNRFSLVVFRKRYPDLKDTNRRLFMNGAVLVVGIMVINIGLGFLLQLFFDFCFGFEEVNPPFLRILVITYLFNILFFGIYEAIYSAVGWRYSLLQTEKIKRESLQSQLDNLKSRVNPHFLFNSLNTLSALIHDRPDDAVKAVEQMARSYRYLLQASQKEVVQIREELENVEAYLFLLQIRFGDGLKVEWGIDPHLEDQFIIPLALQMLIENCIKHNVVRLKEPLPIRVFTEQNRWLVIENPIRPKQVPNEGTGMGLKNIQSRYELMGGEGIVVESEGSFFRVKLPILNIQDYAHSDH